MIGVVIVPMVVVRRRGIDDVLVGVLCECVLLVCCGVCACLRLSDGCCLCCLSVYVVLL